LNNLIEELEQGVTLWKIRSKCILGLKSFERVYKLNLADLRITYSAKGSQRSAIEIQDIDDVRIGHGTDIFNELQKKSRTVPELNNLKSSKDVSFSLIFNDKRPPLDLVASDLSTRDKWFKVLSKVVEVLQDPIGKQSVYLKKLFRESDKNKNGTLSLEECSELISNHLNLKITEEDLAQIFNNADLDKREEKQLNEIEFSYFYYSLLKDQGLTQIFDSYSESDKGKKMNCDDLKKFF